MTFCLLLLTTNPWEEGSTSIFMKELAAELAAGVYPH